jgi:hypothetical protein
MSEKPPEKLNESWSEKIDRQVTQLLREAQEKRQSRRRSLLFPLKHPQSPPISPKKAVSEDSKATLPSIKRRTSKMPKLSERTKEALTYMVMAASLFLVVYNPYWIHYPAFYLTMFVISGLCFAYVGYSFFTSKNEELTEGSYAHDMGHPLNMEDNDFVVNGIDVATRSDSTGIQFRDADVPNQMNRDDI